MAVARLTPSRAGRYIKGHVDELMISHFKQISQTIIDTSIVKPEINIYSIANFPFYSFSKLLLTLKNTLSYPRIHFHKFYSKNIFYKLILRLHWFHVKTLS